MNSENTASPPNFAMARLEGRVRNKPDRIHRSATLLPNWRKSDRSHEAQAGYAISSTGQGKCETLVPYRVSFEAAQLQID